jgi:non-lysosomal glucosylceramidase
LIRSFEGSECAQVRFPLGGIGTGCVSLGGRGQLRDWEIWNHPGKGINLPYTFFALWAQPEGGEAIARVLEARQTPPYTGSGGIPATYVPGLPRLAAARFSATYLVSSSRTRNFLSRFCSTPGTRWCRWMLTPPHFRWHTSAGR